MRACRPWTGATPPVMFEEQGRTPRPCKATQPLLNLQSCGSRANGGVDPGVSPPRLKQREGAAACQRGEETREGLEDEMKDPSIQQHVAAAETHARDSREERRSAWRRRAFAYE
eukprot:scaffold246_cov414-Prasinococcus_capsulatus_cf.AAC.33